MATISQKDKLILDGESVKSTSNKIPLEIPVGAEDKKIELKRVDRISFSNIGENIGKRDIEISDFMKRQYNLDLIDTLKTELTDETRQFILENLTGRWKTLEYSDLVAMNFDTVNSFLSTSDYSHSGIKREEQLDLEDFLGRMIYLYCKTNDVNVEQFRKLFSKLRTELITLRTLSLLATLDQCKEIRKTDQDFSEKLMDAFIFKGNNTQTTQIRRFIVDNFEPKLEPVLFDDIKVDEKYDIADSVGSWYTGKVNLKVTSNTLVVSTPDNDYVRVTFDGWDPKNDETICRKDLNQIPRISKYGSMTNQIPHTPNLPTGMCKCTGCGQSNGRYTKDAKLKPVTSNVGTSTQSKPKNGS